MAQVKTSVEKHGLAWIREEFGQPACPECGTNQIVVVSPPSREGNDIVARLECASCLCVWSIRRKDVALTDSAAILEERKKNVEEKRLEGENGIACACHACGTELRDGRKGRKLCHFCYLRYCGVKQEKEKTSMGEYFWRCSDCGTRLGFTWPAPVCCAECRRKAEEPKKPKPHEASEGREEN